MQILAQKADGKIVDKKVSFVTCDFYQYLRL